MKNVREPAVAGMFYPANPHQLHDELQLLLETANPEAEYKNAVGIISPHAGYVYSGKTAAFGFKALGGRNYKTVVIISPSHREYFPGVSIYNGDAYKTPLGEVLLNKEMSSKLVGGSKAIFESTQGHRAEHAVEVQVPFLQMIMKDFTIVPVVIGDQRKVFIDELAQRLADIVDDETLIIASSDLSHFYTKEEAGRLDSIVADHIKNFSYDELQRDLETSKCEACGGGAIVAMMKTADLIRRKKSKVLSRSDSGDVTGDYSEVVGYLSAVVY